jgi:hypothetical protein
MSTLVALMANNLLFWDFLPYAITGILFVLLLGGLAVAVFAQIWVWVVMATTADEKVRDMDGTLSRW